MTTDDRRTALVAAHEAASQSGEPLPQANGVDFVEVDPNSDTTLNVYFVLNLPRRPRRPRAPWFPGDALGQDNFVISGGERVTSINVVSAKRTADNVMQVVVDQTGDFSVYCLSLQDKSTPTGIPSGFDPASASAEFVFHIDCAGNFDCAPTQECPPEVVTPPPINYLAKDYPGFLQVMLDRLTLLAPAWQERNPADLGIVMVEMLAYVADQLSYRQDVIATEAYLGTARLRTSARRHARLVDYFINDGANSRLLVARHAQRHRSPGPGPPRHRRAAPTWYPGAGAVLAHESAAYQQAVNAGAVFFETMADSPPLYSTLAEVPLYAWSNSEWCLAPGATHATLTGPLDELAPGMVLVLAEVKGRLPATPPTPTPTTAKQ